MNLVSQVLGRLDGPGERLDGEEGRQVGRVRRDHDQREKEPHTRSKSKRDIIEGYFGYERYQSLST